MLCVFSLKRNLFICHFLHHHHHLLLQLLLLLLLLLVPSTNNWCVTAFNSIAVWKRIRNNNKNNHYYYTKFSSSSPHLRLINQNHNKNCHHRHNNIRFVANQESMDFSSSPSSASSSSYSRKDDLQGDKQDRQQHETLYGLFGIISNDIPDTTISVAINTLSNVRQILSRKYPNCLSIQLSTEQLEAIQNNKTIEEQFTIYATLVAIGMCQVANDTTLKKKQKWLTLQETAQLLQEQHSSYSVAYEANSLAVSYIFGSLSLMKDNNNDRKEDEVENNSSEDASRAVASALSSTVSRNKPFRHGGRYMAYRCLRSFLVHATYSHDLNLHILSHFSKAYKLTDEQEMIELSHISANVIRYALGMESSSREATEAMGSETTISSKVQSNIGKNGQMQMVLDDIEDDDNMDDKNDNVVGVDVDVDDHDVVDDTVRKQRISGALGLACQIRPWPFLSPASLIDPAVTYGFWQSAEQVCLSAHKAATMSIKSTTMTTLSSSSSSSQMEVDENYHIPSADETLSEAITAVQRLIDAAMESKTYRLADSIATNLYSQGGKSKYVEARYYHACDTITKVIHKRQVPIVERQVERIDKAVTKVKNDNTRTTKICNNVTLSSSTADMDCNDDKQEQQQQQQQHEHEHEHEHEQDNDENVNKNDSNTSSTTTKTTSLSDDDDDDDVVSWASIEIRKFALQRLEEADESDSAHRLATLWGMEYTYDKQAVLESIVARKKTYLQYDDVLPGMELPNLISTPTELLDAFTTFRNRPYENGPYGFDAEWEEDTTGVEILQLANPKQVLLLDIPALASSKEGTVALAQTVGTLLGDPNSIIVGFACRQDISRLRSCPYVGDQHWMMLPSSAPSSQTNHPSSSLLDVQTMVTLKNNKKSNKMDRIGLSRACHHYFGKPLDKAEQCSMWSSRPLTDGQRSYAAMDAWTCVGIYEKLIQ